MKLKKAIEILSQSDKTNLGITLKEILDAEKLGIEALKIRKNFIDTYGYNNYILLPGETKD